MSDILLFVAGTLVTVTVAAALTLLIIGAILDRRDARARLDAEPRFTPRHHPTLKLVDESNVVDAA